MDIGVAYFLAAVARTMPGNKRRWAAGTGAQRYLLRVWRNDDVQVAAIQQQQHHRYVPLNRGVLRFCFSITYILFVVVIISVVADDDDIAMVVSSDSTL